MLVVAIVATGTAACGALIGLGDLERVGDLASGVPDAKDASVTDDRNAPPPGEASTDDRSIIPPRDAGADARSDASSDASSDSPPNPLGIICGASVCSNNGSAACCLESTPACRAPDAGCSGKLMVCDDTADCVAQGFAGAICCAPDSQQGGIIDVRCATGAGCDPQQQGFHTLCDPGVGCAGGRSCVRITSGPLSGYHECR